MDPRTEAGEPLPAGRANPPGEPLFIRRLGRQPRPTLFEILIHVLIKASHQRMKKHITFELIDQPDALRLAMKSLAGFSSLALDFEMENHYHHYGLHIALIQVSTPDKRNYIFDPLSGIDLQPLGAILTNPDIELVIHDPDFDRRACHKIHGWSLNHFFDTKLAAQLCGFKKFGLASLLNDLLNVQTDKKFQRIDWLKRPLQKNALDYATRETAFLFTLQDIFKSRLTELGRLSWAQEEFVFQEHANTSDNQLLAHYRIKKSASLSPRQLAILRSLVSFRDQIARNLGRPVHYIIKDRILLQLAASPPAGIQELRGVPGLHPAVYRNDAARHFMEAVNKGLTAPEDIHPTWRKHAEPKVAYSKRLKSMQKWRAHAAVSLELEPYLLIPNDVLKWCARNPGEALPSHIAAKIRNWQKALVWSGFQNHFSIPDDDSKMRNL